MLTACPTEHCAYFTQHLHEIVKSCDVMH